MLGFTADMTRKALQQEIEVWPENWTIVNVFVALETSWHFRPDGKPAGLRREAFPAVFDEFCIEPSARPEMMAGLRIMESAAREVFHGQ